MKVATDSCLFGAWVADHLKHLTFDENILDIGSGSGLLSLMIAQKNNAAIDAIELQEADALQSAENIQNAPFGNRITLHHADALLFAYTKQYDAIISNPPFYEKNLKGNSKGKNIAHHDDALQLRPLLLLIKKRLRTSGHFYLLLPAQRMTEVAHIIATMNLYINQTVCVHPTENHPVTRIMLQCSFLESKHSSASLFIKKEKEYSLEFLNLLKDFYLHLQ